MMNTARIDRRRAQSGRFAVGIVLALAVIALLATAAWYFTRPKPVVVAVALADAGRVENTVANTRAGSVMPCRRAKLAPPAGGRIERLNVTEGDRVRPGQVLLTLWNDDLTAREQFALVAQQVNGGEGHDPRVVTRPPRIMHQCCATPSSFH